MEIARYHDAAEAIDWNEIWRLRRLKNRESRGEDEEIRRWDDPREARRYADEADAAYRRRVDETLALLPLSPDARVLDIGSGPGTLALPMAERVAGVTAVEPSQGMLDLLRGRAHAAGLKNIVPVQKRWEEIDPPNDLDPPYDIVLASFSLGMDDLREALLKMDRVSSGSVYLFTFADMPLWERMSADVWTELYGRPYVPSPKADVIWNLLCRTGMYPAVIFRPLDKTYRFGDLETAVSFFAKRFGVSGAARETILRRYLARVNQASDGSFHIAGTTMYAALWWVKDGNRCR